MDTVEETEYDEEVQCDHSYDRRCHTTYVTNYLRNFYVKYHGLIVSVYF